MQISNSNQDSLERKENPRKLKLNRQKPIDRDIWIEFNSLWLALVCKQCYNKSLYMNYTIDFGFKHTITGDCGYM